MSFTEIIILIVSHIICLGLGYFLGVREPPDELARDVDNIIKKQAGE